MEMDLNTPINLDSSISNTSYFAGVNANRAISRGRKVYSKERLLPRYSNIHSEALVEAGEATLAPPTPVLSASELTSEALPNPTPNPAPHIFLQAESVPAPSSQTATPPSTPTQTPTGGGGGGYMGGGGGGGGTAPAEEKSSEKLGGGTDEVECKSNYWILGLALGAIGGYLYAKNKNKEVLKTVLIASAIGTGAGYIVDKIVCKDKTTPATVIPPKTETKTEGGTATKANATGKLNTSVKGVTPTPTNTVSLKCDAPYKLATNGKGDFICKADGLLDKDPTVVRS